MREGRGGGGKGGGACRAAQPDALREHLCEALYVRRQLHPLGHLARARARVGVGARVRARVGVGAKVRDRVGVGPRSGPGLESGPRSGPGLESGPRSGAKVRGQGWGQGWGQGQGWGRVRVGPALASVGLGTVAAYPGCSEDTHSPGPMATSLSVQILRRRQVAPMLIASSRPKRAGVRAGVGGVGVRALG